MNDNIHCFERAGLGKAPFRVTGFGREVFQAIPGDPSCPLQPGTSCDYCGTAIMDVAHLESSDGRRFKVGCDCVAKTGDAGLLKRIKTTPEYRAMQRAKRKDLAGRKLAELERLLADPEVRARLSEMKHPFDHQGRSVLGVVEASLPWCGDSGRARNLGTIKKALAGRLLT